MSPRAFNKRYDLIRSLTPPDRFPHDLLRGDPERRPKRSRNRPVRPSHLRARRYFPTHPYVRISRVLPAKLPTMAELEKLTPEQLAARFLKHCKKFKWNGWNA